MRLGGYQSRSAGFGDLAISGTESLFVDRPVRKFSPLAEYVIPAHQSDNWYCKLCTCVYMGREKNTASCQPAAGIHEQQTRHLVQHTRRSWGRSSSMLTGINCSWNNVVGIATKLLAGRSRVRIPVGEWSFSFLQNFHRCWGLPTLVFNRYGGSFLGIMRPGSETEHSSVCSAQVKNEWSYTSNSPIQFYGMDRDNCTFFHWNQLAQDGPSGYLLPGCTKGR
jgi:hypothetical protein